MRALAHALVLAAAILTTGTAGCSAVIGPRPSPDELLPCWIDDGMDPCPPGTHCMATATGETARCVLDTPDCIPGADEVCNARDDDCDDMVDEPDSPTLCPAGFICLNGGCSQPCALDADGDGYSSCEMPPDCDDMRADINPGRPEICDGIDNDCNPGTGDLTPGLCTGTEICALARGESTPRCLVPDCTNVVPCGPTEACDPATGDCTTVVSDCRDGGASMCGGGAVCDPASGVCVNPRGLGQACTSDVQCTSERCAPFGVLMLPPDAGGATGMCVSACCDDSHCATGFRCWAPGNGVRACVPAEMLPFTVAVTACSGPTCASSDVCDARAVPRTTGADVSMFVCQPYAGGERDTRVSCLEHTDCASGFCIEPIVEFLGFPVPLGEGWCALPCRTSADCNYPISPYVDAAAGDRVCGFQGLSTGERLQMCRDVGSAGPGGNGATCSADSGCHDGFCRDTRCSAVCCADSDCAATEICAAVNRAGWQMRCIPRLATGPG